MKIQLSESEVKLAYLMAQERYYHNRRHGTKDRQLSKRDPLSIESDGVMAEMAMCKVLDCYPDLSVGFRKNADFHYLDWKVDVKSTRSEKFGISVSTRRLPDDVDLYVLCEMGNGRKPGEIEVVGWAWSQDIFCLKPENGYYRLWRVNLQSPQSLFDVQEKPPFLLTGS